MVFGVDMSNREKNTLIQSGEEHTASDFLSQEINRIALAFFSDDGLLKLCSHPLLLPHGLNTLNAKLAGMRSLDENNASLLLQLLEKRKINDLSRENVLDPEGIKKLREIVLLIRLVEDLIAVENVSLQVVLEVVEKMIDEGKLNPLISTEEMYRVRNHLMVEMKIPEFFINANPQMKLEPAYAVFVGGIKKHTSIDDLASSLLSTYPDEHVLVSFTTLENGGVKPSYGMNTS